MKKKTEKQKLISLLTQLQKSLLRKTCEVEDFKFDATLEVRDKIVDGIWIEKESTGEKSINITINLKEK